MSELSHYIKLRSGLSGCDAKLFECDKYLDCDSCLEDKIKEHDKQIRADAIDEFFEMLKNPITLDRLTSSRNKIKTLSIIKYQYGVIKGDFKVGE